MAYERHVEGGLDYAPCRYGASKLVFRGPRTVLSGDYVAYLGSTETYGKCVRIPFPSLTGSRLGVGTLNLGCVNAGVDCFLGDSEVHRLVRSARACVVQVMGAHKLSNRFYKVHPRRNDRFLSASPLLRQLYPEAEFTDVHFTRHLLAMLRGIEAQRFNAVRDELQDTWVNSMTALLSRIPVPVVLLWISDRGSDDPAPAGLSAEPLFVDRHMLGALASRVIGLVTIRRPVSRPSDLPRGMVCSALEASAAAELPGPGCHAEIAQALEHALGPVLCRH